MVFLLGALCYTICTMKAPPQALEGPGEEPSWHVPFPEGSCPVPSRAWRGGFKVFLLGALCYTICTMKAPPDPGPGEEPLWHLPFHGIYRSLALERRLHGVPVRCSALYNMHHEGSSPGRSQLLL